MEAEEKTKSIVNDELDIRELVTVLWNGKWLIIAITFVFGLSSVFYSLSLPNIYRSETIVAPSEESKGGGLANISSQFGGLASLAGINLGASGVDRTTIALEILKSRAFITKLVKKYEILPEIMAVKSWSPEIGLEFDENLYDPETKTWIRQVSPPKAAKPSSWEYVKTFRNDILDVGIDETSGLVTVGVMHQSPEFAKYLSTLLVQEINDVMRDRDIQEASSSLEYLYNELENTSLNNMQQIFYQLIETQTQKIMLAKVRPEYVFQIIDPAVVAEQKAKPSRAIICIIGAMLGGLIAVFILLSKDLFSNRKQ